MNLPKIHGVNFPERMIYKPNKCCYIFKSGKKKNTCCNKPCYDKKYCNAHKIIMENRKAKKEKKIHNTIIKSNIVKLSNKNKGSCCHVMQSGNRKGEWCGSTALYSVNSKVYCKTHAKKYGTFNNDSSVCAPYPNPSNIVISVEKKIDEFQEWLDNNVMP